MEIEDVLNLPPFKMRKEDKQKFLVDQLNQLNTHHSNFCESYKKIHRFYGTLGKKFETLDQFPFIPIRLFKEFSLKSIKDEEVVKTLTSSGTTSGKVSKIYLDKNTSRSQTKALSGIIQDFIGNKRLPMIIVDSNNVIKDRRLFSARGAGIIGLSNFGRDHLYLLDDNMNVKIGELKNFLKKYQGERILIFGFTYIIWEHFQKELKSKKINIDLSNGVLIHSGGWKKLLNEAIDNDQYKQALKDVCGIRKVYNFYGMVEQTGSIFMECDMGCFHAPIFSDVLIRTPIDWNVLDFRQEGIIELVSILPQSYPGHVLLTEDIGEIVGEDDCACGRLGKYFVVKGRIPSAENRGCSDTYVPVGRTNVN